MRSVYTCLLIAVASQAVPPGQQPTFKSTVELVQVDVVVIDKNGNAVRGLTAADFNLTDRKKAQTITSFDEASYKRDAAAASVPMPPGVEPDVIDNQDTPGRLVVMVLDDLHAFKGRDAKVKEIASKIVSDLGPNASMAVLMTSGEGSTQVGDNKSRLLDAIDRYHGRKAVRRPTEANDVQRLPIKNEFGGAAALDAVGKAQGTSLQDFDDNMTTLKTLQDASRLVGANDGRRKAFIWVSESMAFDVAPYFGAEKPPGSVPAGGMAYGLTGEALSPLSQAGVSAIPYHALGFIDMMDAMRRSNVVTFAIDPRGKIDYKQFSRECVPPPTGPCDPCAGDCPGQTPEIGSGIRVSQRALDLVSRVSGGFSIVNTDDFDTGIGRILDDLDHYYMLGFYPTEANAKGWHALFVTVKNHPEYTVRFRHGYDPAGPPLPPKNADPLVALSAGVIPKTDLPLRVFALPLPGRSVTATPGAPTTRVAIALEVTAPTSSLLEADTLLHDEISYEVLVVDDKKSKVTSRRSEKARWSMKPANEHSPIPETVQYQLPMTIDVAPGRYQLRVAAISTKLGKGGSVYQTIDVPAFATGLSMSALMLGYDEGSHVPVGRSSLQAGDTGPALLPFDPALDRAFTPNDTLRLYFEVAREDGTTDATAAIEIADGAGKIINTADVDVPAGNVAPMDVSIPLAALAPGGYKLSVKVSDGKLSASRAIAFVVKTPR
jgi:VWFA-related protein